MTVREYIGARYVPLFMGDWDNTKTYEPLSIVQYEGNSFTSRQYVPEGIDIANTVYWANTGNYNAQVEAYRQEVQGFEQRIEDAEAAITPIGESVDKLDYAKEQKSEFFGMQNNYGPEKIIQIAETYLANNDKLYYGDGSFLGKTKQGDNWVYNNVTGIVDGGVTKFPMSCSSLVMASILGIPYEKSRMANGTGSVSISGSTATLSGGINKTFAGSRFMSDNTNSAAAVKYGSLEGTLHSWQLAEYLNDLGMLHAIENINDLRPGDILFYENWTQETPEHWQNINHCEIFIGFNTSNAGTNIISISGESSGNYAQFVARPVTGTMVATLKWFARIETPHFPVRNLFEGVDTSSNVTGNQYKTIRIADESVPLASNKAYTLVFKLSENSKEYLPLHYNVLLYNGTTTYQNPPANFYVDNDFNEIAPNTYACVVRTTGISDAIAISFQQVENKAVAYDIEWVALYDGIVNW